MPRWPDSPRSATMPNFWARMEKPVQIGSLHLAHCFVVAPMAGVSDLPFRLLCRREGAALAYTEMVSAKGLMRAGDRTHRYLASVPEERPLGVQLFGTDPDELGEAAARLEAEGRADLIDVNMGCPVKKVVKTGAGAALLCDPPKVGRIVAGIRRRTQLPVTIKIRAGWDSHSVNAPEIARVAEAEGADAVTIHARTREQGYAGRADWSIVEAAQAQVRIPIIGSGDVVTAEQALQRATAHRGLVMIGRGAQGRPWIFRQIAARLRGEREPQVDAEARLRLLREHFNLYVQLHGEARATREFRKHLLWYGKGTHNIRELRPRIATLASASDVYTLIEEYGERWHQRLPEEPVEIESTVEERAYWEERGWG